MRDLKLRSAVHLDAELLFKWRTDPETKKNSFSMPPANLGEHRVWLDATLDNANCKLFIVERGSESVGTIRSDYISDGVFELSWTISPHHRGQGIASGILTAYVNANVGIFFARIKSENVASLRVVRKCGFHFHSEENGILTFVLEAN